MWLVGAAEAAAPCPGTVDVELSGQVFRIDRDHVIWIRDAATGEALQPSDPGFCDIERIAGAELFLMAGGSLEAERPADLVEFFLSAADVDSACARRKERTGSITDILRKYDHTVTPDGMYRLQTPGAGWYYMVPPEQHLSPLGRPVTVSCSHRERPISRELGAMCGVTYWLLDRICLNYRFNDGGWPESRWIELDRRLRAYVEGLRVTD